MPAPVALIIGITGQDGSYLAELLLGRGFDVHGMRRRTSTPSPCHLALLPQAGFRMHHGDLAEGGGLLRLLQRVRPDEVYNLAGPSIAAGRVPQQAAALHALGTQRLLDALRIHDAARAVRLFQSSSYEIFGRGQNAAADETSDFHPDSPSGVARLQAYWLVKEARERYGMHASSGISFPHGSARAAPGALPRHIARAVAALADTAPPPLILGALDAAQHWGHAQDHAEAMWRMLQQDTPGDFVLASGPVHPLRHVVERAFAMAGVTLRWEGSGWNETGLCARTGRCLVRLDPAAPGCRGPTGDASRARRLLGWQPGDDLDAMLAEILDDERMIQAAR